MVKYTEFVLFFQKRGKAFPINDMTSRDYEFVKTPTLKKWRKLHISQNLGYRKINRKFFQRKSSVLDPFIELGQLGCLFKY
jgi:hypothetical protein